MAITFDLVNYPCKGYIEITSENELDEYTYEDVTKIIIKRKKNNENGGYITVLSKSITVDEDFSIDFIDKYCRGNIEYVYEMDYIKTVDDVDTLVYTKLGVIQSKFNGLVLCDKTTTYITDLNVGVIDITRNKPYVINKPLNADKPTYYSNTSLNYVTSKCQGMFIDIDENGFIFEETWKYRERFIDWLINGKAKILKHFDGRAWIIGVHTDSVEDVAMGNYETEGARIISFEWTEIGSFTSESDLYEFNLSDVTNVDFSGI